MLGLGLVWTVLIRVPLILNAEDHLDSDLAVDGLTLLDAVNGHWRWHYPGTPYMGILPMFSSYPQALVWGVQPDHARQRRDGHLGARGGLDVLAGVEGFRPGGRWVVDRAAGILVAGHDLAFGPDHGRASADAGLAHRGVRRPPCLPDPGRLEAIRGPGILVRTGALPRRHVPVHSRRPRSGGGIRLAPDGAAQVGDRAGRSLPGRVDASVSYPARSAGGSILTTPIRPSSRRPSNDRRSWDTLAC